MPRARGRTSRRRKHAWAPRIALFGGTFDPPHLGHLVIAEWARAALGLERVLFMPAGVPPHKSRPDLSPARVRLALTRAAVRGREGFEVSSLEARRAGPSYTVDTLRWLQRRRPGVRRFLLIGSDSLRELSSWRDPAEVLRLATPVVARRPGRGPRRGPALPRGLRGRLVFLDNPGIEISSSLVRARVRAGRSIRDLVPEAVERGIRRRGLYRAPGRRKHP